MDELLEVSLELFMLILFFLPNKSCVESYIIDQCSYKKNNWCC